MHRTWYSRLGGAFSPWFSRRKLLSTGLPHRRIHPLVALSRVFYRDHFRHFQTEILLLDRWKLILLLIWFLMKVNFFLNIKYISIVLPTFIGDCVSIRSTICPVDCFFIRERSSVWQREIGKPADSKNVGILGLCRGYIATYYSILFCWASVLEEGRIGPWNSDHFLIFIIRYDIDKSFTNS